MHAPLILQVSPHALIGSGRPLRADRQRNVFEATQLGVGRTHLGDAPAMLLRVAPVHARQVGSEERGLLTAFTSLNFEDDVHGVLWIARRENLYERLVSSGFFLLKGRDFVCK